MMGFTAEGKLSWNWTPKAFKKTKKPWPSGVPGKTAMTASSGLATSQQGKQSNRKEADANDNCPCGISRPLRHGVALGTRNRRHSSS
jgi:negative regulator of sigma E activity